MLIHELGHFVTARWAKVRVLEFGIGFPPRAKVLGRGKPDPEDIARLAAGPPALPPGIEEGSAEAQAFYETAARLEQERQGTVYTLNWLPIGGFVKLEGEDGDRTDDPRAFSRARLPVKLGILIAGVTMNLLLAFVIFTGIALWGVPAAGVRITDVIVEHARRGRRPRRRRRHRLDRRAASSPAPPFGPDAVAELQQRAGQTVILAVRHADGTTEDIAVALRVPTDEEPGALGIRNAAIIQVGTINSSFVDAVKTGAQHTVDAFSLILVGLGDLARSIVTNPTTRAARRPARSASPSSWATCCGASARSTCCT